VNKNATTPEGAAVVDTHAGCHTSRARWRKSQLKALQLGRGVTVAQQSPQHPQQLDECTIKVRN
jgi:hypothetical protein